MEYALYAAFHYISHHYTDLLPSQPCPQNRLDNTNDAASPILGSPKPSAHGICRVVAFAVLRYRRIPYDLVLSSVAGAATRQIVDGDQWPSRAWHLFRSAQLLRSFYQTHCISACFAVLTNLLQVTYLIFDCITTKIESVSFNNVTKTGDDSAPHMASCQSSTGPKLLRAIGGCR